VLFEVNRGFRCYCFIGVLGVVFCMMLIVNLQEYVFPFIYTIALVNVVNKCKSINVVN